VTFLRSPNQRTAIAKTPTAIQRLRSPVIHRVYVRIEKPATDWIVYQGDRSYRVSSLAGVSHSHPFQTSALNPGTPYPGPLKPRVPPIANPRRFILLPSGESRPCCSPSLRSAIEFTGNSAAAIAALLRSVRASGELREQCLKHLFLEKTSAPHASLDQHTPWKLKNAGSLMLCLVPFPFAFGFMDNPNDCTCDKF
jgi:hypothetical protein